MAPRATENFDEYAGTMPRKGNRDRAEDRTRFQISEGQAVLDNLPMWVLRDNLTGKDYPFMSYQSAYQGYQMIRDAAPMADLLAGSPSGYDAYFRKLDTLQNIPDA